MFETLEMAPPDAILGLTEAFEKDPNSAKINLSVGVYQDSSGTTPILDSVKEAERRILKSEKTKGYLGIPGSPEYGELVRQLLFGADHEIVTSRRAVTAQTPGGTGALRVAGDFIKAKFSGKNIWLSQPTWPNHPKVFSAAGLEIQSYPYFDSQNNQLAFDEMIAGFEKIPEGDVVVLHGCCHNPTGIDPTPEQWSQIADVLYKRNLLVLLDFAYQGFAEGLEEDRVALDALARPSINSTGKEFLVCSSFSKNFGLYNERVGALTLVACSAEAAESAMSHIKACIRANYSNPPSHGAAIVTTILKDTQLRGQWEEELKTMRDRINSMRKLFVETLAARGIDRDFSFITRQRVMFSFSGLTQEQVNALREKYSIYIVGSGRINVAGMTEANLPVLCEAIASVL